MGTRHLICVVSNEEYKVTQYGQWDGYPEGAGKVVLNFLRRDFVLDKFKKGLRNLYYNTPEQSKQEWMECGVDPGDDSGMVGLDIAERHKQQYPQNSRDTGAKILEIIQNLDAPMGIEDSLAFAGDSLFCEWAYVIDLDKNTFEAYKGFNEYPLVVGERFSFLSPETSQDDGNYYPVRLIATFDLRELPTVKKFLLIMSNVEYENEDVIAGS